MTVTVGIPTTGHRPVLREAAQAAIRSASLLSDDAEVLVVVNGRPDAPGLGRIDSPMLRVIYLPLASVSGARNVAIDQARHDTVLLVDDDVVVPDRWCAELASALHEDGCQVATAPVRVLVRGPLTAFMNYQRSFDSQPPGPADPGSLVAANCGLRRDLLPPDIRFDERLATGEDTDFGYQLWRAGLRFRLLGSTPVTHDLPEELGPNLRRSLRYGDSTATVSAMHGQTAELVPTLCSWYQAIVGPELRSFRTFGEFASPDVRSAFRIYSFILNSAYVVGCLSSLRARPGEPMLRLHRDRATAAWQRASDRAAELVGDMSAADWSALTCDYSRLLDGSRASAEPLPEMTSVIADLKAELREHAQLTEAGRAVAASTGPAGAGPAAAGSAARVATAGPTAEPAAGDGSASQPREASRSLTAMAGERLRPALDELRRRSGPISETDIEQLALASGVSFRAIGQIIERTFGVSAGGRPIRTGAAS